jgi:hypothetical protein
MSDLPESIVLDQERMWDDNLYVEVRGWEHDGRYLFGGKPYVMGFTYGVCNERGEFGLRDFATDGRRGFAGFRDGRYTRYADGTGPWLVISEVVHAETMVMDVPATLTAQ